MLNSPNLKQPYINYILLNEGDVNYAKQYY